MNLWEINEAIENCFEIDGALVDMETGEILDNDYLYNLNMAREEKIENVCKFIKNLESDAKALKEQKEHFDKMLKTTNRKIESLKSYLESCLDGNTWRAKDLSVQVSYRKSEAVDVIDSSVVPDIYKITQEPKIDKTSIKKAIKAGEHVDGVVLLEKMNMQVK